ncbi:MAG: hypothetical protein GYB50_20700 [Rhodobacteraceae bacterium]|nr:hypothetical protein [Paracoccaceae bacterium]
MIVSKQEGDETVEVLTTEVDVTERELKRIADEAALDQKGEERVIAMTFPCRWSPLVIGQAGYLKVRAYLDDGREIRLGALKMKFSTNDEDTSDDHDR